MNGAEGRKELTMWTNSKALQAHGTTRGTDSRANPRGPFEEAGPSLLPCEDLPGTNEPWIEPKDLGSNFSDGTRTEAGKGGRKGHGIGGLNWIEDGETIVDSKGPRP